MSEPTNSYIKSALIEADQKEKDRVNCSGSENGIVILAREYRSLKAENEALKEQAAKDVVRMAGSSELIAALKADNEALKKGLARWKGRAENEREENQDLAKRLRSRAEAAERKLAQAEKDRDEWKAAASGRTVSCVCGGATNELAEIRERMEVGREVLASAARISKLMAEFSEGEWWKVIGVEIELLCDLSDRLASPPSPAPVESKPKQCECLGCQAYNREGPHPAADTAKPSQEKP